jgi:hypothetical protein
MLSLASSIANPKPANVRKYGPALCLALTVPKLVWDFYVLKYSDHEHDDDDDDTRDPTLLAAMNAGTRGVKEAKEAWKVLTKYAPCLTLDSKLVEPLLEETESIFMKDEKGENCDDGVSDEDSVQTNSSDGNVNEDEGDVDFFKQWEKTVRGYQDSLFKVLGAKADDKKAEDHIREKLKCLVWLLMAFQNEFRLLRNKRCLEDYVAADKKHSGATGKHAGKEKMDSSARALILDQKNRQLVR